MWKEMGEMLTNRQVEGTLKFGGGNVMMWGCMFWEGIGYATRIEGNNAQLFCSILEDELQQIPDDIIFKQDNDPNISANMPKDHSMTMTIF